MSEPDRPDLGDNAKRAAQRAAYHFLRAAIEVVSGIDAFLDEITRTESSPNKAGDDRTGRERIDIDE